ncbi:hypothetical protein VTK73DRAFT_3697 [Phialemonium thermophilum]|uniref:Secreted protein n=1 Tax=Phialemonium thermophilum TaxID=223376 RepID=A0ABR3VHV7_9PEZI
MALVVLLSFFSPHRVASIVTRLGNLVLHSLAAAAKRVPAPLSRLSGGSCQRVPARLVSLVYPAWHPWAALGCGPGLVALLWGWPCSFVVTIVPFATVLLVHGRPRGPLARSFTTETRDGVGSPRIPESRLHPCLTRRSRSRSGPFSLFIFFSFLTVHACKNKYHEDENDTRRVDGAHSVLVSLVSPPLIRTWARGRNRSWESVRRCPCLSVWEATLPPFVLPDRSTKTKEGPA